MSWKEFGCKVEAVRGEERQMNPLVAFWRREQPSEIWESSRADISCKAESMGKAGTFRAAPGKNWQILWVRQTVTEVQ
jgi:hypothetical protein